jgi:3-isopropylmalate/(R)-2-methylmalate dehydratase small subunit
VISLEVTISYTQNKQAIKMALSKITSVSGKAFYLPGDDIDTDRIIPARFMKCVTFDGLGQYAFYDVRFEEDGQPKDHPMNKPENSSASILLSGKNFGCGSSREHAPQALFHWGFRAIVAESFAEIFFGNCTTLGIPCVSLNKSGIQELAELLQQNPGSEAELDLQNKKIKLAGKELNFEIPEGARSALIQGQWDSLAQLLDSKEKIQALSKKLANAF